MFDSPQNQKNNQLCLTQSPKYYPMNNHQIFVGSYDYEPFDSEVFHDESLNLNLNFTWSVFSQRTPKTDRISYRNHQQVSDFQSTFTDRSMCQGFSSILSQKAKISKNKNQNFSQFINTTQNIIDAKELLKEVSLVKTKQQLKKLTKNILKQTHEMRQPLQEQFNNNSSNINIKKIDFQSQAPPTRFKHINKKVMPTRKNLPKFKKSQIIKEAPILLNSDENVQNDQNSRNIQFTNAQLSTIIKFDPKMHEACIQIYRFSRRKEQELAKKKQQKQQTQTKYKQMLRKKSQLKQRLKKMKQELIQNENKIQAGCNLHIQKMRRQMKSQFSKDWDKYFGQGE